MQADRFTTKAAEAVQGATKLAADTSTPEVASAHLLLSLLDQAEGMAAPVLQRGGTDPAAVREKAKGAVDDLPKLSGNTAPDIRPSKEFTWVIQEADRQAERLGDDFITVGHLLLALSEGKSGVWTSCPIVRR